MILSPLFSLLRVDATLETSQSIVVESEAIVEIGNRVQKQDVVSLAITGMKQVAGQVWSLEQDRGDT